MLIFVRDHSRTIKRKASNAWWHVTRARPLVSKQMTVEVFPVERIP